MQIHETAFIISTYRSLHEEISKDPFAKLWNNKKTNALLPEILKTISPHESILHSIRNRFFLDQMDTFFQKYNGGTLLNFGAGFSMYQFMLPDTVHTIEIDKKEILDYKKENIDKWIANKKLPHRNIKYLPLDFTIHTKKEIIKTIKPHLKNTPIFILLEGVLFFLDTNTTSKLFDVFNVLQSKKDRIGSVSYIPDIESTAVYKKLLHYFDSNNDTHDSFAHQTIPNSYYNNISGYKLKVQENEYNLSKIYNTQLNCDSSDQILNEHLYILEKTDY